MEPVSPSEGGRDPQALTALESQIREAFGRVAYSHKVHEKDADRYFSRGQYIKIWQIILSAITTGGIIAIVLGKGLVATIVSAAASTILLILNSVTKELNLGELAQKHSETATRLWSIRESYLSLLADLRASDVTVAEVRKRRNQILEDLAAVYANGPRTSPQAYKAAQKALQVNQELTFSAEEIDRLLPPDLRRGDRFDDRYLA